MWADAEEEDSDDDHGHYGNDDDDHDQLRPTTVFFGLWFFSFYSILGQFHEELLKLDSLFSNFWAC